MSGLGRWKRDVQRAIKHAVDCGQSIVNYRTWMIKVAHRNVIAAFDFAQDLSKAKSVSGVMDSRARTRAPDTMLATQSKELSELSRDILSPLCLTPFQ